MDTKQRDEYSVRLSFGPATFAVARSTGRIEFGWMGIERPGVQGDGLVLTASDVYAVAGGLLDINFRLRIVAEAEAEEGRRLAAEEAELAAARRRDGGLSWQRQEWERKAPDRAILREVAEKLLSSYGGHWPRGVKVDEAIEGRTVDEMLRQWRCSREDAEGSVNQNMVKTVKHAIKHGLPWGTPAEKFGAK